MTATATGTTGHRPGPRPSAAASRSSIRPALPAVAVSVVVLVGILVRLYSPSELWLDEALSVNIARLDVPDLLDALRRDGSPPLYYLILHGWMEMFGQSNLAVRVPSTLFSIATLPVVWLIGRRLGGPRTAWAAVMLLAVTPFAVRYATEARMYALVQLLTAVGLLLVLRALEQSSVRRLLPVSLVSGALALTHYWALFLLAATGLLLLLLSRRGSRHSGARRVLAALTAGGLLFLPWLGDFLFQVRHTGTPWAASPSFDDLYDTVHTWAGGNGIAATVLTLMLLALTVLALAGHRPASGRGVLVGPPVHRVPLALLAVSGGTLLLGLIAGMVVGAGYAVRYSSVALIPAVLLAVLGLDALSRRLRRGVLSAVVVAGLIGCLGMPFSESRTQAGITAARITAALQPGDLIVYCPDQLGPAVSRLLPAEADQVTYPLLTGPELINWVDYAERNARASAPAIGAQLSERTTGAIFVVWAEDYRTYSQQCEELNATLRNLRGGGNTLLRRDSDFGESQRVDRYPGVPTQTVQN